MTVPETILARIKKLQALAADRAATPGEAAAAAAKVQELLFAHNLTMVDVEGHRDPETYVRSDEPFVARDRFGLAWHASLLNVVARYNFCRAIWLFADDERGRTVGTDHSAVIGEPHNVEAVRFLYVYLGRAIDRLVDEALAQAPEIRGAEKVAYRRNFGLGAVGTIAKRLREQRERDAQASATSTALVRVTTAALDAAERRHFPKTAQVKNRVTHGGYQDGARAGAAIPLNRPIRGAPARDALGGSR